MTAFSIGDLASTFMLQRRGAALKAEMLRLNEEMASGQVSDVKRVLAGNVSYLGGIERSLNMLSGFGVATAEAAQYASAMQSSLDRMDKSTSALSNLLLTVSSSAAGPVLDQISSDARVELDALVSALGTSSGGRSLFAGNATNSPAIADSTTLLDGLRDALAGATTVQEIEAAATLWFHDPTGFEAEVYLGSPTGIAPFRLAEGEAVSLDLKASDPVFRDLLKGIALAAVADDPALNLSAEDRKDLLGIAGNDLFEARGQLTATQAHVGSAQARIDVLMTRNATEATTLEFAKGALLQADPYETATELEAVQFQLQSLYAVTARMSDLSFVNFIR